MSRAQPEIDRLLDEGLTRYSRGDLDGALASWRRVLTLAPQHEQALGYIDYVRVNYELLAGGSAAPETLAGEGEGEPAQPAAAAEAEPVPFAIGDPELGYVIQIEQGELAEGSAEPRIVVAPDGWAIEDEEAVYRRQTLRRLTFEPPSSQPEIQLSPSDPEIQLSPFDPDPASGNPGDPDDLGDPGDPTDAAGVNFDDATKEYGPGRLSAVVLDDGISQEFRLERTPGFGSSGDAHTPPGFAAQRTEIRRRDTGYVQPTAQPPGGPGPGQRPGGPAPAQPSGGSGPGQPVAPAARVAAPVEPPFEPVESPFDPSPDVDPPTTERSPMNPLTAELLAALPGVRDLSPPRGPATRGGPPARSGGVPPIPSIPPSSTAAGRIPIGTTPAPLLGQDELPVRGGPHEFDAPTERKDARSSSSSVDSALAAGSVRGGLPADSARPRSDLSQLVAAPTRDLGLRQGIGALSSEPEDEPTMTAGSLGLPRSSSTTHNDLVLPFDPIAARSAQILDAIDRRSPAPPDEPREDRTRRRITALFEHAVEWARAGELDRAVTAVDLALSEDPNSALAQKLIHRNRDTTMNVFQSFLGDLHRTPVLARPLHELASSPISPRAAFLLSRVDGLLSLDEILDVSGMPRTEAYRYLCQLFLRGILR